MPTALLLAYLDLKNLGISELDMLKTIICNKVYCTYLKYITKEEPSSKVIFLVIPEGKNEFKLQNTGTPPITRFSYTAEFYLTQFFLSQKPR